MAWRFPFEFHLSAGEINELTLRQWTFGKRGISTWTGGGSVYKWPRVYYIHRSPIPPGLALPHSQKCIFNSGEPDFVWIRYFSALQNSFLLVLIAFPCHWDLSCETNKQTFWISTIPTFTPCTPTFCLPFVCEPPAEGEVGGCLRRSITKRERRRRRQMKRQGKVRKSMKKRTTMARKWSK